MKELTTDVVIIGAGPVGLFQVFELGIQGLKAVVIDTLPHTGGQCRELYPEKPIYDIPGLPKVLAGELIDNLIVQAQPFAPQYLLGQRVISINKQSDHKFEVITDDAIRVHCQAVIIAGGNGGFEPVKLKVPAIDKFQGRQLFYRLNNLKHFSQQQVVILGGGDSAFDWAFALQQVATSVVMIHRSMNFRAMPSKVAKMQRLCDQLKMQFLCGQVSQFKEHNNNLTAVIVHSKDGLNRVVELNSLVVCFGLSPKMAGISSWGLAMHHHQIIVDTEKFESSQPGIYAVGDINFYPGKRKLILSGFHEAALAAFAIAQQLTPNKRVATLYTTTSPVIQKRMGLTLKVADLADSL